MSLSPKHTTPFSVTDILSPIEESYKKTTIEASIPPLIPPPYHHRSGAGVGASAVSTATVAQQSAAAAAMSAHGMSMGGNPYANYVPQLSHHGTSAFPSQYCNGADLTHYGDPMTMTSRHSGTASWYGANPDPRLASRSLLFSVSQRSTCCTFDPQFT